MAAEDLSETYLRDRGVLETTLPNTAASLAARGYRQDSRPAQS